MVREEAPVEKGMRLGKYEIGRTLGEGNFGKVKFARHVESGRPYAVKVLDRKRIQSLKINDQIKREINTLKLLKHPNVVRLHEVSASRTKIYMVLEYVDGGELFDKIESKGRLSECEGRRLFQQLIDAISYCHNRGVYHRDLKPENVLIDANGNIKISDFGLSALPQHLGTDGLLHTTCGSPNYIAPEVLTNRGYDGAMSDIWSCGVILYVMLTGSLPFDDRNLAVLYQKIFKGDFQIPKWLSREAQTLIRRILDPNPKTRINVERIKVNNWFKQDYTPVTPYDDDDDDYDDEEEEEVDATNNDAVIKKTIEANGSQNENPTSINAFELIGMSSFLDLSGFFEAETVSERKIRFTLNYSPNDLFEKIERIVGEMGCQIKKGHGKMKVVRQNDSPSSPKISGPLSIAAEVFELGPSLYVVELRKSQGDSSLYRELCSKLSVDLGVCQSHQPMKPKTMMPDQHTHFDGNLSVAAL